VSPAEDLVVSLGPYALFAGFAALGMGIPLPMLVLFGSLGLMVDRGVLDRGEAVTLVFAATVVGDAAGYLLFYFGGRMVLERILERFPAVRPQVEKVERWYRRYGLIAIVLFRWINWGQGQVIWLSGLSRLPALRFFPVMAGVNLAWAAVWSYIGIGFIAVLRELAPWALAAALGLAGALALWLYLVRRGRLPAPAWLTRLLTTLQEVDPPPSRPRP
jgi:membrane protein DedA with SNARE-associated domain